MMLPLVTPRLILRQFAPGDWDAVKTMLSDPITTRFMHFGEMTEDEGRQWFDWCVAHAKEPDANPLYWAITRKDSGQVIGWLGIGTSSDSATPGERSIGYLLDHSYWNQGYMTEVVRAVLAYEFGSRGALCLRATCNVTNLASARVLEKVGMRREQTVFDVDAEGNRVQQHHYAITKAEHEAQR